MSSFPFPPRAVRRIVYAGFDFGHNHINPAFGTFDQILVNWEPSS
jgi:hypothetical protein